MTKIGPFRLTQKRDWWYMITTSEGGKQTWVALRTKDIEEARKRAVEQVGAESVRSDRENWLKVLVEKGEWAKKEPRNMRAGTAAGVLNWTRLFEAWRKHAPGLTRHDVTLHSYELTVDCRRQLHFQNPRVRRNEGQIALLARQVPARPRNKIPPLHVTLHFPSPFNRHTQSTIRRPPS